MQKKIELVKVNTGIFFVIIPDAKLRILCGCPADTVKHLKKRGLIDVVEKDGVRFETGPNTILLSDILLQNGHLSNLAEFPLLQMLYSQGMLIPNHPGNTGDKPLLMGHKTQITAQMEYFYRGNYGLINKEEILATGVSEEQADELMHIKLKFAFGKIKTSDTLVDQLIIDNDPVEIRNEVFIKRKDVNIFEISYHEQYVVVDLNLKAKEYYEPPYYLSYYKLNREYFSVIHTGEGDAWDVNRPCMASMIMFQGKIYLVDAGPDLLTSLNALGISINEIAGIFNTHAHDDHFAGLISFVRSDHRIKYFASPLVRSSVAKKLCALMSLGEESFYKFFDVHDLTLDTWNNIEGLDVMPMLSPHPVETNIFYFRAFWGDGYCSYGHLADVASFRVLEDNIYKNTEDRNMEASLAKVKRDYLIPTDLKKIDVGGGMIHGEAKDFANDATPKIFLAHIARPLSSDEKQIGSNAPFGAVEPLVDTQQNFLRVFAREHLHFYFPSIPDYDINFLLNCPVVSMNAGDTLFRRGMRFTHVYLLLTGAVEIVPEAGMENSLSAGSLVGFYIDDQDLTAKITCRASCHIWALQIPAEMYLNLVKKHNLVDKFNVLEKTVAQLSSTWLLSENISLPIYIKIANSISEKSFTKGESITIPSGQTHVYILKQGQCALLTETGGVIENLKKGDFVGIENSFPYALPERHFEVFFLEDTEVYAIPIEIFMHTPIVYWKLLSTAQKRHATLQ